MKFLWDSALGLLIVTGGLLGLTADSDDLPDGIPIKSRTVFRELTGRDSD